MAYCQEGQINFHNITDEERCACNVTDVVVLKAETFQISLGVSHPQTSQVTFGLLSHSNSDHARNSSHR